MVCVSCNYQLFCFNFIFFKKTKIGAVKPTAVFVPLKQLLKEENFELCTTEIFGPFQVIYHTCIYIYIYYVNIFIRKI